MKARALDHHTADIVDVCIERGASTRPVHLAADMASVDDVRAVSNDARTVAKRAALHTKAALFTEGEFARAAAIRATLTQLLLS